MRCHCATPQDYFEFLIQLKHIYLSVHVQHALFVSVYTVKLFKVLRFVNCIVCCIIIINAPSKYNFNTIHLVRRENCSFSTTSGGLFYMYNEHVRHMFIECVIFTFAFYRIGSTSTKRCNKNAINTLHSDAWVLEN